MMSDGFLTQIAEPCMMRNSLKASSGLALPHTECGLASARQLTPQKLELAARNFRFSLRQIALPQIVDDSIN
jgi:hypothetical protein